MNAINAACLILSVDEMARNPRHCFLTCRKLKFLNVFETFDILFGLNIVVFRCSLRVQKHEMLLVQWVAKVVEELLSVAVDMGCEGSRNVNGPG